MEKNLTIQKGKIVSLIATSGPISRSLHSGNAGNLKKDERGSEENHRNSGLDHDTNDGRPDLGEMHQNQLWASQQGLKV